MPKQFEINVFPNPFNSFVVITVSYSAGVAGNSVSTKGKQRNEMTLNVYDLRGNLVATPCSADRSASFVPLDKGDRNRASAKVSGGSWTSEQSVSGANRGLKSETINYLQGGLK